MCSICTANRKEKLLKQTPINTWQGVYAEILRRLSAREYKPGELLPHEATLADEFGCARATVNRALQSIAEEGLLERRRRGGTRVVVNPERKATLVIPIIRLQVEQRGFVHEYRRLNRRVERPPGNIRALMQVPASDKLLYVRALHLANTKPHVLEHRWINLSAVPSAAKLDFSKLSPNEWLVNNIPVSDGTISLSAAQAIEEEAKLLQCKVGGAVFAEERLTRNTQGVCNTWVRLVYAPGYQMTLNM
ncbi:MAG: GntR family transcriptional regulator [Granulosicoccus sp.]